MQTIGASEPFPERLFECVLISVRQVHLRSMILSLNDVDFLYLRIMGPMMSAVFDQQHSQ